MIPRNHIKMRSTFSHQIRPLQVHQKQDADRRHTPCSEKGVILWSQFHKVSQPDWLLRNETDIPQVVCCRSLSTANCGHSLTWSPRSHTHSEFTTAATSYTFADCSATGLGSAEPCVHQRRSSPLCSCFSVCIILLTDR